MVLTRSLVPSKTASPPCTGKRPVRHGCRFCLDFVAAMLRPNFIQRVIWWAGERWGFSDISQSWMRLTTYIQPEAKKWHAPSHFQKRITAVILSAATSNENISLSCLNSKTEESNVFYLS
jgi:hypothetical protein